MRLVQNYFLVTADPDLKRVVPIKGHNGEPLMLDTRFDPLRHSTQIGQIAFAPLQFSSTSIDSNILKPGDTVWFHHFVCQENNKWLIEEKEYYQAHFEQIWAKVEDDTIIPVNDWLFVEPIPEDESTLWEGKFQIKLSLDNKQGIGHAFAVSKHAEKQGIHEGDLVYFIKDADYNITIGEKKLWRMKTNAVVLVKRNDGLLPLNDKILIKYTKKVVSEYLDGIWVPPSMRDKALEGIVQEYGSSIRCVAHGDKVVFFPGMYANITIADEDYAILRKEFLICIK